MAVICIGQGARLHKLACICTEARRQPAQWDANIEERHRRLARQLGAVRHLEVWCHQKQLISAVGVIASTSPSLVSLKIVMIASLPRMEFSPIESASLESVRITYRSSRSEPPPPHMYNR